MTYYGEGREYVCDICGHRILKTDSWHDNSLTLCHFRCEALATRIRSRTGYNDMERVAELVLAHLEQYRGMPLDRMLALAI